MQEICTTLAASICLFGSGVLDALRLYRCLVFFVLEPRILEKTARCFVLNGAVFLGSIATLCWVLKPAIATLLAAVLGPGLAAAAMSALDVLFHLSWLLPAYAVTFVVNWMWYGEIAELAAAAAQRRAQQQAAERKGASLPPPSQQAPLLNVHRPDALVRASEEAYKAMLLSIFFLQVLVAGLLPAIGPVLNAVLLSWMNALYCYDAKWSLHGVPLNTRIRTLEEGWAFFLGFGAVTVLPSIFAPFYVGAALLGALFPLFIIMACDSNPKEVYRRVSEHYAQRGGAVVKFRRLPVFGVAVAVTNALLATLSLVPKVAALVCRFYGRKSS